jgi:hypothetical protein
LLGVTRSPVGWPAMVVGVAETIALADPAPTEFKA